MTGKHGVRRTTPGEVEIPSYSEREASVLMFVITGLVHTSHLSSWYVSLTSSLAKNGKSLTAAHVAHQLVGNPAFLSHSRSVEDPSMHSLLLRKSSQQVDFGPVPELERHPHRFTLVHALQRVRTGTKEEEGAVLTMNAPPLASTDLGRVADASPTLLSEDTRMSFNICRETKTSHKSLNAPMSGGRAWVLSLSTNNKPLLRYTEANSSHTWDSNSSTKSIL
jgi:hypothetical protein